MSNAPTVAELVAHIHAEMNEHDRQVFPAYATNPDSPWLRHLRILLVAFDCYPDPHDAEACQRFDSQVTDQLLRLCQRDPS